MDERDDDDAIRESPPSLVNGGKVIGGLPVEMFGSSNLMKEISVLRDRLKELEEDRSTVEDPTFTMEPESSLMKKEIAKMAEEKARQERELLNSLSSMAKENNTVVAELKVELTKLRTENSELKARLEVFNVESKKWGEMSAARVADDAEIRELKELSRQKDLEITEKHRDISSLLRKVENIEAEKVLLSETNAAVKDELDKQRSNNDKALLELDETRDELYKLQDAFTKMQQEKEEAMEQMGEMNDSFIELELQYKKMKLNLAENRSQLESANQKNSKLSVEVRMLKEQRDSQPSPSTIKSSTTDPEETEKIGQAVVMLEERLRRFQERLSEKDEAIEKLSSIISKERKMLSTIKKENKYLKRKRDPGYGSSRDKDHVRELHLLRKQNRELSAQLVKSKPDDDAVSLPSPRRRPREALTISTDSMSSRSLSVPKVGPATMTPPRSRYRATGEVESPRTPVSGLVASFERRIKAGFDDETTTATAFDSDDLDSVVPGQQEMISDLRMKLQHEKNLVAELEREIATMKTGNQEALSELERKLRDGQQEISRLRMQVETLGQNKKDNQKEIEDLQEKLAREKKTVTTLREEIKGSTERIYSMSNLEMKLRDSEEQISSFRSQIDSLERTRKDIAVQNEDLRRSLRHERDEVSKLREELTSKSRFIRESTTTENSLYASERDVLRLRQEVDDLEKQRSAADRQIDSLKDQLFAEQSKVREMKQSFDSRSIDDSTAFASKLSEIQQEALERKLELQAVEQNYKESQKKVEELNIEVERVKEFEKELELAVRAKEEQNENISRLQEVESSYKESQKKVEELSGEVVELKNQVEELNGRVKELNCEIERLEEIEKSLEHEMKDKKVQTENISRLQIRNGALQEELNEALTRVQKLQSEASQAQLLKEEKDAELQNDADFERVKEELTKTQVAKGDLERDFSIRVKDLEREIEAVEIEAQQQIDDLQKEVATHKQDLLSKDEEINRLESERAQLCNSMSSASMSRNEDFEELESALMDRTAQTNAQAREIQTLKMKIEEIEKQRLVKEQRLNARLEELQIELQSNQAGEHHADIEKLVAENHQLREALRDVKADRRNLQDRLDSFLHEKSSSKSAQVLRDRNLALKLEVEKLTKRLKKMEESITRFAI